MQFISSLLESLSPPEGSQPSTIVLRPNGCLGGANCLEFQQQLHQALELTTETVVVDLLWVDAVEAEGIQVLIEGLQKATQLDKILSLRSLDLDTRAALEAQLQNGLEIDSES